ncbi:hypothetical protein SBV1_3720001 [Verrucomicrobia bacterium]|nr:hypothetical protein SBV1_3720001 [Verrucomicrobiota bacterium]
MADWFFDIFGGIPQNVFGGGRHWFFNPNGIETLSPAGGAAPSRTDALPALNVKEPQNSHLMKSKNANLVYRH